MMTQSTERYNGWCNWDTWEAFNLLTSCDEQMYKNACKDFNELSRSLAVNRAEKAIKVWYFPHEIAKEQQINFNNVVWAEIARSLNGMDY